MISARWLPKFHVGLYQSRNKTGEQLAYHCMAMYSVDFRTFDIEFSSTGNFNIRGYNKRFII